MFTILNIKNNLQLQKRQENANTIAKRNSIQENCQCKKYSQERERTKEKKTKEKNNNNN